jgi:hypothetical protein
MLFDHNVPRKLRKRLLPHLVTTAAQMGWAALANGLLIEAAEERGFDLFLTWDQGIRYQQDHRSRRMPIVLLSSTYWPTVDANHSAIRGAIEKATDGSFTVVMLQADH